MSFSQDVYKMILLGQENEYLKKKRKKKFLLTGFFPNRKAVESTNFFRKNFENINTKILTQATALILTYLHCLSTKACGFEKVLGTIIINGIKIFRKKSTS